MGAAGRAVLLPGSSPAWSRTLVDVTGLALVDAGWETHPRWWDPPGTGDPTAWVEGQLTDALAGLDDRLHDTEVAAALVRDATTVTLVEVPGADHALHVGTDAVASAEALVILARAVVDFAHGLGTGAA